MELGSRCHDIKDLYSFAIQNIHPEVKGYCLELLVLLLLAARAAAAAGLLLVLLLPMLLDQFLLKPAIQKHQLGTQLWYPSRSVAKVAQGGC